MRTHAIALLATAALGAGGCGSDDATSTSAKTATTAADDGPDGRIRVVYDEPTGAIGVRAREVLKAGGTDGIAEGFTSSLKLTHNIDARERRGGEISAVSADVLA